MSEALHRLKAVAVVAVFWAIVPLGAAACEVCFGGRVDTPTTRGISMAMLALIGMTGIVGGGIGAFFYNMKRRTEMLQPGDLEVTELGNIQDRDEADDTSTF